MRENHHDRLADFRRDHRQIFIKFVLFFSLAGSYACQQNTPDAETSKTIAQPSVSLSASPVEQNAWQEVAFKGVKVRNYISQISTIEGIEKEATPLEGDPKYYKPDFVRPRHITLKFTGDYAENIQLKNYPTEINVYPVNEFRQAFAESPDLMKAFDEEIITLRRIISQTSPPTAAGQFPFLLFLEYSPVILVHPQNVTFRDGRGISYVTQFDIEPSAISSGELTYVFQGMTNDGKYYISAFFPVRAKNLNEKDLRRKFAALKLPIYGLSRQESARLKNYLLSVQTTLNKQKAEDFEPNLNEIEKTISSLETNGEF